MNKNDIYKYSQSPLVVFEDYYIAVIYKPPGYSVERHPNYPSCEDFLHNHLQIQFPNNKRNFVGVVHRLDVLVGGLLIMAKTMSALKQLNSQFSAGTTKKIYRAWLQGVIDAAAGSIEGWIEEDKKNKKAIFRSEINVFGKKALLHYKTIEVLDGKSQVEIQLETGRFHQIRVSFAAKGCPIVNDVKYGATPSGNGANAIELCAFSLGLNHPKSGEKLEFSLIN